MEPIISKDFNLQNTLSFDNLTEKLDEIKTDGNLSSIDLRHNRLDASCLPKLLKWLSEHEEANICVGCTNIGISEICKSLLSKMGNVDWVINGWCNSR